MWKSIILFYTLAKIKKKNWLVCKYFLEKLKILSKKNFLPNG